MLSHNKKDCPYVKLLGCCVFNMRTGEHLSPIDFMYVTNNVSNAFEPSSDARVQATSMFEQYTAYVQAGFTPVQAFQFCATMLAAAVQATASDPRNDQ